MLVLENHLRNVWQTSRIESTLLSWDGIPSSAGVLVPTIQVNSDLWTSDTTEHLTRLNGDSESGAKIFDGYCSSFTMSCFTMIVTGNPISQGLLHFCCWATGPKNKYIRTTGCSSAWLTLSLSSCHVEQGQALISPSLAP